jgi:membrane protein
MFAHTRAALVRTGHDVLKNQTWEAAAALSYYSIFSIFPALMLLSALLSYIRQPELFQSVLDAIGRVLPAGTMTMVNDVLDDILRGKTGAWLSLGTLGILWVVSSAFDEMIDALNGAYDVDDPRPFWKIRLLALGMAAITGIFLTCAIVAMKLGPRVGDWLAMRLSLSGVFLLLWPYIHWTIAVCFGVLGLQTLYYLAPYVKHRFRSTLPGALLSTFCWIGLSYLLGLYFRYFGNYNRTYGTLAGVMALLTSLYWAYFVFLTGGELNAELCREEEMSRAPSRENPAYNRRRSDRAA